jgi:hypothetical protein
MEPKGLSQNSQELSTCPYSEPDQSSSPSHPTSPRSIVILFTLVISFPLVFPTITYPSSTLCKFLHPPVTSSLLGPNILFSSTLFSNIPSLSSSLNVRGQVSHPYRTMGKIIVLYILMFTFFDSRREDGRVLTER